MNKIKNWSLGADKPPRPQQIKICDEIQTALDDGYKNIILEAGTGIGKSAMATTIALNNPRSYIITMTKQLQDQYYNDFEAIVKQIKGRNAYTCLYDMVSTCDKSNCQTRKRWNHRQEPCNQCNYKVALKEAKASEICLTNYDYLYYAGNYSAQLDTRNLLILDETHNLETKLMNLISETLSRNQIMKDLGIDLFYPITTGSCTLKAMEDGEFWIGQLEYIIEKYRGMLNSIKDTVRDTPQLNQRIENKVLRLKQLIHNLSDDENRWVIELPKKKEILADKASTDRWGNRQFGSYLKVDFKPLYVANYADELLQFGDHRLFMTGTLGNLSDFCRWNGLDEEETYYIHAKSPFRKENRPIYKVYAGSMARKNYEDTLPRAKQMVKAILGKYPDSKGVIHVSSYAQARDLENLSDRIIAPASSERDSTIHMFERSDEPWVIVSPSIKDGVDFKGDKCRFQIIFKVPYPSLAGKQTMIKVHYDQRWYNYNTVMPLMQAYGRGIRDEDDYCDTYILDSDFSNLYNNNSDLFNEYFTEALVTVTRQKGLDSIVPAGEKVMANVMGEVPVQMTFETDGGLTMGK